jgi:Secretion system C-terminal sorting domain
VSVTQSATAHGGSSALQGAVVSFAGISSWPAWAMAYFPYNQRPGALTGYYQLNSVQSDSLAIIVYLYTGAGGPVAAGVFETAVNKNTYTQFTAPLEYVSAATPDSAYIWVITMAGQNDTLHVGTQFLVDDLAFTGSATAVEQAPPSIPSSYALDQNYPNPFNPSTSIRYELPSAGFVRLSVYNLLGQEVAVLVNQDQSAGAHEARFDASTLPSGVYLYRLSTGSFSDTKRMTLVR